MIEFDSLRERFNQDGSDFMPYEDILKFKSLMLSNNSYDDLFFNVMKQTPDIM